MAEQSFHRPGRLLTQVLEELGLVSLYNVSLDVKLLCAQRFVRLFAYGGSTLILASYLSILGNTESQAGLFMTLTIFGDIFISFFLTLFADALGRRIVLAAGALLMTASGIVFGLSNNFYILLAAAIFGVISPSGNEIGPFRAVELSTLAHLTPPEIRGDIYAWHSLIGQAGAACGLLACGWVSNTLSTKGWSQLEVYRVLFFAYAFIGLLKFLLTCILSWEVESEEKQKRRQQQSSENAESTPLLQENSTAVQPKESWSLLPSISRESKLIIIDLCILFSLDSFASGLASLSWVTYFFKQKFHIEDGKLGSLFFISNLVAAASMLVASSLAKRIGNVKTMVFTHLPSTIALSLIPVPSSAPFAILFLILRSSTASMDVAPRSAFLATIILPNERTAALGTINVVKTASQSLGPLVTGVLANKGLFWVAFILAGSMKAVYDLGMLALFAGRRERREDSTSVTA